jgi:hypothetical protein
VIYSVSKTCVDEFEIYICQFYGVFSFLAISGV